MKRQLDTSILFNDIRDVYDEFQKAQSPKAVRRLFCSFLTQTQQLTDIMRVEFKELTGKSWEAKTFSGWTKTSAYFKKLRNMHVHASLARINVQIKSLHKLVLPDIPVPLFLNVSGVAQLDDQLLDENPQPVTLLHPEGPNTKEVVSEVQSVEYSYVLSDDGNALMNEHLPTMDLNYLVQDYFHTLSAYYDFYTLEIAKHSTDGQHS